MSISDLQAGEIIRYSYNGSHEGVKVAGVDLQVVNVTPTLDTSAYASGRRAGSIQEITNAVRVSGGTGILQSLSIVDKAKQGAALRIYFFNALPTIASADNAPYDISDTEAEKQIHYIDIASGDWAQDSQSNYFVSKDKIGKCMKAVGSANLYAIIVAKGSATYAANSLYFSYEFLF
jgi:hypothetical protein